MGSTLLLDQNGWDLLIDASGNIAVAAEPYALAQDAASAIKTFEGECYWNDTIGVPYLTEIFGKNIPLPLLKQEMISQALTVPNVVSAQFYVQILTDRTLTGQVQTVSATSGQTSAAPVSTFGAINPQGGG